MGLLVWLKNTAENDRFNWRLPVYAAAGALIVFLPLAISSADLGQLFYLFVTAIVTLALVANVIQEKRSQRLSALSILVVYCSVSAGLFVNYSAVRDDARWLLWSKGYKAQVLAQPANAGGELKHVEWDGWGFPGAGYTVVYVLFDPNDLLSAETRSRPTGKVSGIPCEVRLVHRLENHWYSVTFYTDTDWAGCR
jgi:hypothetical protein